jgi:transmembrane sensor
MTKQKDISILYQKYLDNKISREEFEAFLHLLEEPEKEQVLAELIGDTWEGMFETKHAPVVPFYRKKFYWAAAAAVFFTFITGAYFMVNKPANKNVALQITQPVTKQKTRLNESNVILTLANGSEIILDSAKSGTLAQQGNTVIVKLDNGQLAYSSKNTAAMQTLYNTISTPSGAQYQLTLDDGSKVWLNALSTLHFPASFSGKQRIVELEGEGYFEIAKNTQMPFIVNVKSHFPKKEILHVKVLGTHFNINAYKDEPLIKTTLLEGSVEITNGSVTKKILAGEQAILSEPLGRESELTVVNTDPEDAIAWKGGLFSFQENDIQSVMRELSRWYNVNVNYEGNIPDEKFVGRISKSRYENIRQILEVLEKTRTVHFELNGKNITVMPLKKK